MILPRPVETVVRLEIALVAGWQENLPLTLLASRELRGGHLRVLDQSYD